MDKVIGIFIFFVQLVTIYYTNRMRIFARQYSKEWGAGFTIFLIAMIAALVRRIVSITWSFGLDGSVGNFLHWVNDYPANLFFTLMWLIFVVVIYNWWNKFFNIYLKDVKWADILLDRELTVGMRENTVGKREDAVKDREDDIKGD